MWSFDGPIFYDQNKIIVVYWGGNNQKVIPLNDLTVNVIILYSDKKKNIHLVFQKKLFKDQYSNICEKRKLNIYMTNMDSPCFFRSWFPMNDGSPNPKIYRLVPANCCWCGVMLRQASLPWLTRQAALEAIIRIMRVLQNTISYHRYILLPS